MVSAATAPASKFPSRGPPVTTAIWIELSRVRNSSGIEDCRIVLRSTALITSAHPATARHASATQSTEETPNAAIASPQTITAITTARPRRRTSPTQPVVNAPMSAPAPGAA